MRITFLLPNVHISGGIVASFELANALVDRGHQVTILYQTIPGRDGRPWWNLRKTAVQIVKGINNLLFPMKWFPLKASLMQVSSFNQVHIPDADLLVVTWWANVEDVMKLPRSKGAKLHFIRSLELWGGKEKHIDQAYNFDIPKIVTSTSLKQTIEHRYQKQMLGIVPDGVNTSRFKPRDSFKNKGDSLVIRIGMMYRKQKLKRMQDGLQILSDVTARNANVEVVLFGESINIEDKKLVSRIPKLTHHRFPNGDRLRDIYQSLDIFLFTSGQEEAFALPPMEAMACGCAVLATRVGALSEYSVEGETALLHEPGDIEAMIKDLELLVHDDDLRHNMAKKSTKKIQGYSWETSAIALENIAKKLN